MTSEAGDWSCFCTAPPASAALSCSNIQYNKYSASHSVDFVSNKLTPFNFKEYFHHSSLHQERCNLESAHFNVCSSCPCVSSSSNSGESVYPPQPPKRQSVSFICVAQHIKTRANLAKNSYDQLFHLRQRFQENTSRKHSTELQVSMESTLVTDDLNAILKSTEVFSSTPSFTPPPPIESFNNEFSSDLNNNAPRTERTRSPMFIYSYDPPTPEKYSEYDPPLPIFKFSQPSKVIDSASDDKIVDFSNESSTNANIISRPSSDISSSTLTASLLLTQDSDMSPLPPHVDRVSPMNTDTMTPSTPPILPLIVGSSATYTCTSPTCSIYSDVTPIKSDISTITMNNFTNFQTDQESNRMTSSTENLDDFHVQTPDTICVSPLQSDRFCHSQSKTSEERSQLTQSVSDSQKKSLEGVSDPTNFSSDLARRSSPSSPAVSLSSLPSDTITMNAGIESIGTDSDPNEPNTWSTDNIVHDGDSIRCQNETDSAFGSPSISPTFTRSCTITPTAMPSQDSCLPSSNITQTSSVSGDIQTVSCSLSDSIPWESNVINSDSDCYKAENNYCMEYIDENTENESIYPESECDIRLVSRADTDVVESQKDGSPDRPSVPIIAELYDMKSCKESNNEYCDFAISQDQSNRILNEISSSGNSSMSNSPSLSIDQLAKKMKKNLDESLHQSSLNNCANSHLSNWLNDNQRGYDIAPKSVPVSCENYSPNINSDSNPYDEFGTSSNIRIEEIESEPLNNMNGNGNRNFSYFGPLPTIHEVVDTPSDQTPPNEILEFSPVEDLSQSAMETINSSPIISPLVYFNSPQTVSTTGTPPRSMNTPAPSLPPPPPPRIKVNLRTPPVPPPPDDDESVNLFPLPPLPSDEDCLPPLPPPPISFCLSSSPPPVPPHAPSPPQRMYLLIPLASGLRSPRKLSPPPAPLRSTSLRRSPPPPPPRSTTQTPSREYTPFSNNGRIAGEDFEEEENRSPSSASDVGSVICVSKLTPDDRSKNVSPLPPALSVGSLETFATKLTSVLDNRSKNASPLPPALSVGSLETFASKLTPVLDDRSKNAALPHTLSVVSLETYNTENILSNSSVSSENYVVSNSSEFDFSNSSPTNTLHSISSVKKCSLIMSPSLLIPSPILSTSLSPPPPPPPRGKISLTPPLPPAYSFAPYKLSSTNSAGEAATETKKLNFKQFEINLDKESSNKKSDPSIHPKYQEQFPQPDVEQAPVTPPPVPPPPCPPPLAKLLVALPQTKDRAECSQTPISSPLVSVSNFGKLIVDRSDIALPAPDEEVGRVFSSGLRWGWLRDNVDTIAMYTQLRPIIQHGPQ